MPRWYAAGCQVLEEGGGAVCIHCRTADEESILVLSGKCTERCVFFFDGCIGGSRVLHAPSYALAPSSLFGTGPEVTTTGNGGALDFELFT